jgi:hypothetical protein
MSQGEQKGPSYILVQHKGHQWIERRDGLNRLPHRYSYYNETSLVVYELNRLMDHIKRLEEAGDELVGSADAMEAWRKAKEAKP